MEVSARHDRRPARSPEMKRAASVIWHDLECGSYLADLPLWRELTDAPASSAGQDPESVPVSVLDVGAGTGRVALDLARRHRLVTALDRDADLLSALRERAGETPIETVCADARTFQLERRDFDVILMPMQTVQLLGGADGRAAFMQRAREHLRPGGLLSLAIVTELEPFDCAAGDAGPSPEIARVGAEHYVSRAMSVSVSRQLVTIERKRNVLSAGQSITDELASSQQDVVQLDRCSAAQLLEEGQAVGLTPAAVRAIPATSEHVGSEVVLLAA